MIYVLIFGSCILVVELFLFLDLWKHGSSLVFHSRDGLRVLTAADLGDDEKEAFARSASLAMLRSTTGLTFKILLIAGILYLLYGLTVWVFPSLGPGLSRALVSPAIILSSALAAACYARVRHAVVEQL
jgi:hypothetical protein